jgi:hypothetical protein
VPFESHTATPPFELHLLNPTPRHVRLRRTYSHSMPCLRYRMQINQKELRYVDPSRKEAKNGIRSALGPEHESGSLFSRLLSAIQPMHAKSQCIPNSQTAHASHTGCESPCSRPYRKNQTGDQLPTCLMQTSFGLRRQSTRAASWLAASTRSALCSTTQK